jgi:general secretion pathway protein M
MIKAFWEKLDVKQRPLAAGAIAFVVLLLIIQVAVYPFWKAKDKLTKSIQSSQTKLNEMTGLNTEFSGLDAKISKMKRAVAARTADFSLFSHLEKKAAQAGVRGNIKYMNSTPGVKSVAFEETLIDMKLDKITIKQLTDFLYYAESPSDMVRIKRINIGKMKESPEYLSAQLQVSSFQPLNQQK